MVERILQAVYSLYMGCGVPVLAARTRHYNYYHPNGGENPSPKPDVTMMIGRNPELAGISGDPWYKHIYRDPRDPGGGIILTTTGLCTCSAYAVNVVLAQTHKRWHQPPVGNNAPNVNVTTTQPENKLAED
jgi:hypothetical protein